MLLCKTELEIGTCPQLHPPCCPETAYAGCHGLSRKLHESVSACAASDLVPQERLECYVRKWCI